MKPYLFINPKAGLLKGCQTADEVKERLQNLKTDPEITIGQTSSAIKAFITKCKKDKPEYVYVAGGDGTISTIIKGLLDEDITFGLIPTGSMNNIGQSLGLGDEIEDAVNAINDGKIKKMDLGKINGDVFIESIGIGLVAEIMDRVGEQDSKKEVLKVAQHTIAEMVTTDTIEVKMKADGEEKEFETVWLTITNTGRAAAALVSPNSDVHDKQLDIVYCEPLAFPEVGKYVIAYMRNSHIREDKFHHVHAQSIEIYISKHVTVHVDGELRKWRQLKVEVIPEAVKVLVP